jgi:hypothetical protein
MRTRFLAILVAATLPAPTVCAQGKRPSDLDIVLDRAIRAAGGEPLLSEIHAVSGTGEGRNWMMGPEYRYRVDFALQPPDQQRTRVVLTSIQTEDGNLTEAPAGDFYISVIDGGRCWHRQGGKTTQTERACEYERESLFVQSITYSPLRLRDKSLALSRRGIVPVGTHTAVALRVEHKTYAPVTLYYDKDNGDLLKRDTQELLFGPERVIVETLFSGHRSSEGIRLPFRMERKRVGTTFEEFEITDMTISKKRLPDRTFAKP